MRKIKDKIGFEFILFILGIVILVIDLLICITIDVNFEKNNKKDYFFIDEIIFCKNDYNKLNIPLVDSKLEKKDIDIKKYCDICGEETLKIGTVDKVKCNNCGNINSKKSDFCSNCGKDLSNLKDKKLKDLNKYYQEFDKYNKKLDYLFLTGIIGLCILGIGGFLMVKRFKR